MEKLVRDRIPTIIRASGLSPETRTVKTEGERVRVCCEKLQEELRELLAADQEHLAEEAADVFQVIELHASLYGVHLEVLSRIQAHVEACVQQLHHTLTELLDAAAADDVRDTSIQLMERVEAFARHRNVTFQQILSAKQKKLVEKGGFEEWIVLKMEES